MSTNLSIIKGIAITPPVIGRIMMGHLERHGANAPVPQCDDSFTITTLVQQDDRSWEIHPIMTWLQQSAAPQSKSRGRTATSTLPHKLQAIPIRLAYNAPALNLHSSYSSFDPTTGRLLCTSDGQTARRVTDDGVATFACSRPDTCGFAQHHQCQNMSRFYLQIEGQDDALGTFLFRSSSWNSLTYLAARLAMLHGLTGGRLAGLPLTLHVRAKSTTMSARAPIYYADLVLRPGMTLAQAVNVAKEFQKERAQMGLSQDGMEQALAAGLLNSDFAEQLDDLETWRSDEEIAAHAVRPTKGAGLRGLDQVRDVIGGREPTDAVVKTA